MTKNKNPYLLIIASGLVLLSILGSLGLVFRHHQNEAQLKLRQKQTLYQEKLTKNIERFTHLQKDITRGISFFSYNQQLVEIVDDLTDIVTIHPQDFFSPSRDKLRAAVDDYLLARECWQKKLDNRLNFIDSQTMDKESNQLFSNDPLFAKIVLRFPDLAPKNDKKIIDIDKAMELSWQSASRYTDNIKEKYPFLFKASQ